ncbi:CpaF family protein [Variovorax ginsengisoli]|uniref:Pilus assembly protein CpaF n=1 Tax=Variovorax ginsengisoli TaxID=363844 RepID=A0ABT9SEB5_9BURK|nr:CpaF family protein [Variovorax ginsengisoli]MDP9902711.1 pilus assembly protein CpaF [Variovorax ginsengisoli]
MSSDIAFADDNDTFRNSQQFQDIKSWTHEHLLSRIEELGAEFGRWSRASIQQFVELELDSFVRLQRVPVNDREMLLIADALTKELAGFGPLEDLLNDPDVEDILINGHKQIYVSRHGVLQRESLRFNDEEHVLRIVRRILAPLGRRLDESNPMVDARLPDGGRINAIIEPLAIDGMSVSIRKFRKDPLKPADLVQLGTFDATMAQLLEIAVKSRCNIIVSGGTSSGKTSLLNALATFIPETERVVTIEDTAELSLGHAHVVRLESRPGGFDGAGIVSIRDLLRNSLRMRPDRIIVGEVRGAEVIEMMQAMNTGHDGSMGTIHASSPRECLYRLEMLAGFAGYQGSESSLRRQIANAVDFIVQIGRLSGGQRRILSISEITGVNDNVVAMQELYRYDPVVSPDGQERDRWVSLGIAPHSAKVTRFRQTLQREGGDARA